MSGENSLINIATAQVGDGPQPADFQMQHTGSVFQAAPAAASEAATKNFRILADGTQFITNDPAVPLVIALPTDAATETTLAALNAAFAAEDFASETTLAALNAKVTTVDTDDVRQALHDNLNANANVQIANVDASAANPVPVTPGTGSFFEVRQATHDNLNANANMQVGNTDVIAGNPVPISFGTAVSLPPGTNNIGDVDVVSTVLAPDAATETTLAALNAAFAAEDFATQTTLAAINTKTPSLGQAAKAGSVPVTLATDEDTLNVAAETPAVKTVKQAQIAVGTAAVRLTTDAAAVDADRVFLSFRPDPNSAARFFYGSSSVTAANGHEVFPGESIERLLDAGDYHIISDTAAQTVHVVEQE